MDAVDLQLHRAERWDEIEPRILRAPRPGLQTVLERAMGLLRADSERVVAGVAPGAPRPTAGDDVLGILEARERHQHVIGLVRDRTMAAEDAWLRFAKKEWLGDERRWFVCDKVPRTGKVDEPTISEKYTSWVLRREPSSIDYITTLCTDDPANVVAAEELAREACRRMSGWGGNVPERVIWLAEPKLRCFDYVGARPFREHADRMLGLTYRVREMVHGRHWTAADEWRAGISLFAKRDLVRAHAWPKAAAAGALPAAMPSPFEPILDIWRLGYALLAVHDDGIVLGACAPELYELLAPLGPA